MRHEPRVEGVCSAESKICRSNAAGARNCITSRDNLQGQYAAFACNLQVLVLAPCERRKKAQLRGYVSRLVVPRSVPAVRAVGRNFGGSHFGPAISSA